MRSVLLLATVALFLHRGEALECYACDSYTSGGACEFDAASTGITTTCNEKYDYCFTRRIEEEGRNTAEIYRGCCRIETGSPTCPPGADYQVVQESIYTYYFTRCQGDLCNDTDGLEDGTEENGGALIVEGVPEDYDYFHKDENIVNGVDMSEDDYEDSGASAKTAHVIALAFSVTLSVAFVK